MGLVRKSETVPHAHYIVESNVDESWPQALLETVQKCCEDNMSSAVST